MHGEGEEEKGRKWKFHRTCLWGLLFQWWKSEVAYRSASATVVMEHETSLNSHFAVPTAQPMGSSYQPHSCHYTCGFSWPTEANPHQLHLKKKKQAFLISYWNTDATAQCLNGNVIRYMNKLHEPVREGRKKLKKQIYQWTNVNGQDSWFTGSKQGSNWICTASAKAAAYWTICFLITLRCSFCWILVKMPCWIRATLCLVLPQPSPVVG